MIVPLRIARENYVDNAILSVGAINTIGSLPVSHLKDEDIQRIWRSGSTSGDAIIADLGASVPIGMVGFYNTNLGLGDPISVRISTSDPTGQDGNAYNSGLFSAGVDPTFGNFLHFIEPGVVGRYVRIEADPATPPWEAGRLQIAPTWIPSRNFSFGWEPARQDHSRRSYSLSQNIFVDRLQRQRVWRFTLRGLTEAEFDSELEPINRINGASRDILVCRDKNSSNLGKVSIWGLLDEALAPSQPHPNFFEAEFQIRERL